MLFPRCRVLLARTVLSESWLESSQAYCRRFQSSKSTNRSQKTIRLPPAGSSNTYPHHETSARTSRSLYHNTWDARSLHEKPRASLQRTRRGSHERESGTRIPLTKRDGKPRQLLKDRNQFHEFDNVRIKSKSDTIPIIEAKVHQWVLLPHVHRRMEAFGIPRKDLVELLGSFLDAIRAGMLTDKHHLKTLDFNRFTLSPADVVAGHRIDQVISQLFFAWASDPATQSALRTSVFPSTLETISRLYNAADLSFPADEFPAARAIRRKVIMHVGPTNSGKTHMALRALAAAPSGLYAGPLRLLAHEIWERLNKGQIVPLGMDPEEGSDPDTNINTDTINETGTKPTLRKSGNSKYVRKCNLRTGEEFRVVSERATLLSCTVEMAALNTSLDVAVVDEIQMIADPERGSAWTMAVLGIAARELHLCGEEAAVPVIKEILKDTGDEVIVNRYERLTPLAVQGESLHGNLSRVQKGDCLVTFSRQNIFALKKRVEEETGLLCAVAYGKLPPEIRSEQAALFNDPDSGYDVIIASDAIGMGLNLKIKRVVFHSLRKFDGYSERSLSVSQIKQIAGRAGRYGLHGEPGGFVTTLNQRDLPILKTALSTPPESLTYATIDPAESWMEDIAQLLPSRSSIQALFEVPSYVSRVRPPFRAAFPSRLEEMARFIDTCARDMLLAEKLLLKNCPTSWRETNALDVLAQITHLYKREVQVDLDAVLAVAPLMTTLEGVEEQMTRDIIPTFEELKKVLRVLEDMHKTLVLYLWLGFRNYMAFHQAEKATALKSRVEKALEWCLRQMSGNGEYNLASDDIRTGDKRIDGEDQLEYHQKRRSRDTRDDEVKIGVAAAEVVAAAHKASLTREMA
ncbi:P-loop containing nucleoside triphosphate hydrolase protein [Scleroderma yunnanense]